MSKDVQEFLKKWRAKRGKLRPKSKSGSQHDPAVVGGGELKAPDRRKIKMSRKGEQFYKIFKREWAKRFQLVSEDGTPLEMPETEQDDEELSQKLSPDEQEEMELTEEELEEMELIEEISHFLDELEEKIESGEEEVGESKFLSPDRT